MNHLLKFFIICGFFGGYLVDAQYIVKKDTLSGTELSFSLDERINDALEKIENNCNRTANIPVKTPSRVMIANRELTNAEICRKNPKIMGFKIQVVIVKNNEDARKVATEFRNSFRNLKVETDASLRPNYKILAGSYFSKQGAAEDLRSIRRQYPSATIVPYAVFCVDAK